MRKIILTILTTTLLTQVFAGILENRSTGETLEFNLDRSNREIQVLSTSKNISNDIIKLESVGRVYDNHDLLGFTNWTLESHIDDPRIVLLPATFILDAVSMIVRAPMKALNNARNKKDYKKLMRSINSTETITVSDKRFRRIEKLLK